MTPREFLALKKVWAMREAQFHNAHFKADDLPFIGDDFMDSSSRVLRKAKLMREKSDVLIERQRLDMMKKGTEAGGVPEAFMVIGKVN